MLICVFILTAGLADLWPLKNTYCFFNEGVMNFNDLGRITLEMRYCRGGSNQRDSIVWLSVIKLFYGLIPDRALCLRVISVFSTVLSLFILYRLTVILFSSRLALLFIFLLVTSPIFVESMRAWGWNPFSHLVVVAIVYLAARSFQDRWPVIRIALISLLCFFTLSLYVVSRMVIFLPVLFFGIYLKSQWRKLLLFLIFLTGYIVVLDMISGGPGFDLKGFFQCSTKGSLVTEEWLLRPKADELMPDVRQNIYLAVSYLAGLNRTYFADKNWHSRFFNEAYVPFFFLGLLLCFRWRKWNNVLVLLLLLLFLLAPLATSRIEPRRILFSIYPVYLCIALGIRGFYHLTLRVFPSSFARRKISYFLLFGLLAIGGYDIFEFFSAVSRPDYPYTQTRLRAIADGVVELGKNSDLIIHTWSADNILWGNPYLVNHPDSLKLNWMQFYERHPLRVAAARAEKEGKDILFFFTFHPHPYMSSPDWIRLREDISWTRKNLPDMVKFSSLPGTELYYARISGRR